ncbi:PREDICTED: ephrin type-A receptor 4-A-like [Amphimedon queenslandica]|uniref:Fibronectin type-III domain-containing protein n=1 Tax=Amphimedon queenslandica TaxID=400682 RepID=A0A1X7TAB5_AMPQE|nr:PREDICTED: ephrin type-A receptor 4-A-like [Amphimedon queenslandica]|eukprot:XP_019860616.1 PREDICTED: ephrin type-A receptor 4-A-like [Amphimedon queenslandica]
MGLTPLTTYTITITSNNGVSDQDMSNELGRQVSINVTTSSPPSSPQPLALQSSPTGQPTVLTWSEPQYPYGVILRYNILVSEFNDSDTATVRGSVNGTTLRYDLSQINLLSSHYFIWVQAVTMHGESDLSLPIQYFMVMSSSTVTSARASSSIVTTLSTTTSSGTCPSVVTIPYTTTVISTVSQVCSSTAAVCSTNDVVQSYSELQTTSSVLLSILGVFLLLSIVLHIVTVTLYCYMRNRKIKESYKPVPAVLSMKECAATDIDEESK